MGADLHGQNQLCQGSASKQNNEVFTLMFDCGIHSCAHSFGGTQGAHPVCRQEGWAAETTKPMDKTVIAVIAEGAFNTYGLDSFTLHPQNERNRDD